MNEPKFRAVCECGTRQPRATTAFTVDKWMHQHKRDAHGLDQSGRPLEAAPRGTAWTTPDSGTREDYGFMVG